MAMNELAMLTSCNANSIVVYGVVQWETQGLTDMWPRGVRDQTTDLLIKLL